MIMPRGQQLLLPVNPVFIGASLVAALAFNMLPLGRVAWTPDVLVLLLAFWGVHQPLRVGMGLAFALGLCMDVQQSALLGQHALAYTVLMYGTRMTHRRVLWFRPWSQALQMIGLFALAHAVQVVIGLFSGGGLPGLGVVVAPLLEALLWPLASWVLLAPQRRAPDHNENRP
ncbi:rod shape-determining protein MreD [Simplicispira lacusdiani]|uniref:rod shape-determining protein MreD n=1 Tax=Simplicispira lacusdiani TaxID=2213010 RepID=UPI000E71B849|nr:rod shape-determining protein MreD [Simplicispira lacusdiani]